MRILMIHADRFSYRVTERTSAVGRGDELDQAQREGETDDALVVFCRTHAVWLVGYGGGINPNQWFVCAGGIHNSVRQHGP